MKKIGIILGILLGNVLVTFGIIYFFVLSKVVLIEEGVEVEKNIEKTEAKVIVSEKSKLIGDIQLKKGEIIFRDTSYFKGDIHIQEGTIRIDKDVIIDGNIYCKCKISIGENSKVNGDISKQIDLDKHSTSTISGGKPRLFVTSDYPEFMKYFDVLPEDHKNKFGYIYLTSNNMDIRGQDVEAQKYYKKILFYKDNILQELDLEKNPELVEKIYKNSKKYIDALSEKKIGRFGIGFVTKSGAFDKKKADMYISSSHAGTNLFMHEYGHIMDYAKDFIDYHNPTYPYPDKKNVITDYGSYHKGEDFAEGYRFYVLHSNNFITRSKKNAVLKRKYNYFKKYVFSGLEYN